MNEPNDFHVVARYSYVCGYWLMAGAYRYGEQAWQRAHDINKEDRTIPIQVWDKDNTDCTFALGKAFDWWPLVPDSAKQDEYDRKMKRGKYHPGFGLTS